MKKYTKFQTFYQAVNVGETVGVLLGVIVLTFLVIVTPGILVYWVMSLGYLFAGFALGRLMQPGYIALEKRRKLINRYLLKMLDLIKFREVLIKEKRSVIGFQQSLLDGVVSDGFSKPLSSLINEAADMRARSSEFINEKIDSEEYEDIISFQEKQKSLEREINITVKSIASNRVTQEMYDEYEDLLNSLNNYDKEISDEIEYIKTKVLLNQFGFKYKIS